MGRTRGTREGLTARGAGVRRRRAGPFGLLALLSLLTVLTSAYLLVRHDRATRPTVPAVAAAAARGSTEPAPPADTDQRGLLALTLDRQAFPDWTSLGWRADGLRRDRIGGRAVVTVEYAGAGDRRLTYSLVEGTAPVALGTPDGSYQRENVLGAKIEVSFISGGSAVRGETEVPGPGSIIAAFQRNGRTVVLTSNRVDQQQARTMLKLANWRAAGRLGY